MAHKQLVPFLSGTTMAASAAPVTVPGPLALFMAGLSIASKEWLFRITKVVGEKLNSPVVVANAWHHRSDAYSSVLALLSIAWAMSGFPAADAAAGLLVAGMIGMTGCDIMVESIQQLSDSAHLGLQEELQMTQKVSGFCHFRKNWTYCHTYCPRQGTIACMPTTRGRRQFRANCKVNQGRDFKFKFTVPAGRRIRSIKDLHRTVCWPSGNASETTSIASRTTPRSPDCDGSLPILPKRLSGRYRSSNDCKRLATTTTPG